MRRGHRSRSPTRPAWPSGSRCGASRPASFVYDLYFQALSDADEGDARHVPGRDSRSSSRPAASTGCGAPASSGPRRAAAASSWSTRTHPAPKRPHRASRPRCSPRASRGRWPSASSPCSSRRSTRPSPATAGRADLVALDEDDGTAYLRLSGGCQGCAMSQMTLRQGIETTLLEEMPELTRVARRDRSRQRREPLLRLRPPSRSRRSQLKAASAVR